MADDESQEPTWLIVQIEDGEDHRAEVEDRLKGEIIAGRAIEYMGFAEFDDAKAILSAKKADLLILDVFRGEPTPDGLAVGLDVLAQAKQASTAPVILYTALPSQSEHEAGPFVRLVNKEDGTPGLWEEVQDLFSQRLPQMHRAVADRVATALTRYMWDFASTHWDDLAPLAQNADFLQMVLQRLALDLRSNEGMAAMLETYGLDEGLATEGDVVPAAALYLKPPVVQHPMLGDIRRTDDGDYVVVLQPSCDLVPRPDGKGGAQPKCNDVLCLAARIGAEDEEFQKGMRKLEKNPPSDGDIKSLIKNSRKPYLYFLPAAWDLPDLVVDLRQPRVISYADLEAHTDLLATLAPPFGESLAAKFCSYIGRVGTPDLDVDAVIHRLGPPHAPA